MSKRTKRKVYQFRVTDRELAAILGGLRLLLEPTYPTGLLKILAEILIDERKFASLTDREIDALSERLTFST